MEVISLNKNTRLVNSCKKAGLTLINPKGAYNGFGYEKLPLAVVINNRSELLKFNKLKKEIEVQTTKTSIKKTDAEKNIAWAKRLSTLTGISIKECTEIAEEKLNYKQQQIDKMENLQYDKFSQKRATLIRKMERENPLRPIKDKAHAEAIISAQARHQTTNYENKLEEGREMAKMGLLDKGDVKEYARLNFKK